MAHRDKITTSKHGRRLGLELQSTAVSGGSRGTQEYLVGPEALRVESSTAETTAVNLQPFGISHLNSSSAASSQVYTLDPPVPGVTKIIYNSTDATAYVKTANDETIVSSKGSTNTVVAMPVGGASLHLVGATTAEWLAFQSTASGIGFSTST